MALIIEKDQKHGNGDLYVLKRTAPGMGWRAVKTERLTAAQVRELVAKYLGD